MLSAAQDIGRSITRHTKAEPCRLGCTRANADLQRGEPGKADNAVVREAEALQSHQAAETVDLLKRIAGEVQHPASTSVPEVMSISKARRSLVERQCSTHAGLARRPCTNTNASI